MTKLEKVIEKVPKVGETFWERSKRKTLENPFVLPGTLLTCVAFGNMVKSAMKRDNLAFQRNSRKRVIFQFLTLSCMGIGFAHLFLPADCYSKLVNQCSLLNIPTRRSRIIVRRYSSASNQTLYSITNHTTVLVIMEGNRFVSKMEGNNDLDAMIHRLKNIWQLRQTYLVEATFLDYKGMTLWFGWLSIASQPRGCLFHLSTNNHSVLNEFLGNMIDYDLPDMTIDDPHVQFIHLILQNT